MEGGDGGIKRKRRNREDLSLGEINSQTPEMKRDDITAIS